MTIKISLDKDLKQQTTGVYGSKTMITTYFRESHSWGGFIGMSIVINYIFHS